MADIIKFPNKREAEQGQLAFAEHQCGEVLVPVCTADTAYPVVVALVCPKCDVQFDVNHGVLDIGPPQI